MNSTGKSEDQTFQAPKVLFFDVNETLLDLDGMKKSISRALGDRQDLLPSWFSTLLQYSLVMTVGDKYEDFDIIGAAALRMVARNHEIELSEKQAKEAVQTFKTLPAFPEVKKALKSLKDEGFILAALTNSPFDSLRAKFDHTELSKYFDRLLSVEEVGKFKPHPEVYSWAAQELYARPSECLMISAHGWDIAGALWSGWRAAFVNRPGQQLYPLAPQPEIFEEDLRSVAQKLIAMKN